MPNPEIMAIFREQAAADRAAALTGGEYSAVTERGADLPDANVTFDDPLCDAPGYLDPLHPDEPSLRCQIIAGHEGGHFGYLPVRWGG